MDVFDTNTFIYGESWVTNPDFFDKKKVGFVTRAPIPARSNAGFRFALIKNVPSPNPYVKSYVRVFYLKKRVRMDSLYPGISQREGTSVIHKTAPAGLSCQ